jgi:hypothetical protein
MLIIVSREFVVLGNDGIFGLKEAVYAGIC